MPLKIRLSRRRASAVGLAAVVAIGSVPLLADVNNQSATGANGSDGANGTVTEIHNPNGTTDYELTPGGNGGDGTVAESSAKSDDLGNVDTATGGNGGTGGNGAASSPDDVTNGGSGGAGAFASADAEDLDYLTDDPFPYGYCTAVAHGGNGGNGGAGGSLRLGPTADGGAGGEAGSAEVTAAGYVEDETDGVQVYAAAYGGSGGNGAGLDAPGGDGGVASFDAVNAFNEGVGSVSTATALAFGGAGGHGSDSSSGGSGASENLNNTINIAAYAAQEFTVDQVAAGGDSGGSNGGAPGQAGIATSSLTYSEIWATTLNVTVSAYGGGGGTSENTNGAAGGSATAMVNLGGGANLNAEADVNDNTATNGPDASNARGSDIDSGAGNAGAGGSGTASATTTSIGTQQYGSHAISTAVAFGGNGGNIIDGATGNGGAGGTSNATASATSPGSDGAQATATATGGAGGSGAGSGHVSGNGGSATASAAVSVAYPYLNAYSPLVQVQATATGGNSDAPTSSAASGAGGAASASASINNVTISQAANPTGATGAVASVSATSPYTGGVTVSVGTSNVNSGSVTVTGPDAFIAGITGSGTLTVGGSVPTSLQFFPGTGASSQSAITIAANATLDITNNHLLINYGSASDPVSTIRGYLKSGFNGGAWNGPGIISSTAQTPTSALRYGVGWADGNDKIVSGLSSGQIEVKYTLLGDANLDAVVNGSDFSILAANFGQGHTNWDQGDFLYTSAVNGSDFSALAANFGQGDTGADVKVSASDKAALEAFAIANDLPIPVIGAVPEPNSLPTILCAGVLLIRARKTTRPGL